jgi:hypothetical protein
VELAASIPEALLAGAEGTEVLGRLWDDIVVDVEVDTAALLCGVRVSLAVVNGKGSDEGITYDRS